MNTALVENREESDRVIRKISDRLMKREEARNTQRKRINQEISLIYKTA